MQMGHISTRDMFEILSELRTTEGKLDDLMKFAESGLVKPVRCRECKYWQKPQVRYYDPDGGKYVHRDYLPGEIDPLLNRPGVTADVGVNIGSYCNGYWTDGYVEDGCHEWKGENDYCSKGERRESE